MISTSSPLAVQAGLWALDEGGTAVDAAIATDAVLGVVEPFWTGIGGDAFCLVADGAEVVAFNGSGAAPSGLSLGACQAASSDGTGLPDDSPLAVTVPGVVDAWSQLSERFGRLGLGRVLAPARQLASAGFPLGRQAARAWRAASARLRPGSPFPRVVRNGERFANPGLAEGLDAIARGGRDAHYEGAWANEAVRVVTEAGGVLGLEDLGQHRGEWTVPITGSYRGFEILQHPPNGQGAAVLAALARLDREPAGQLGAPSTIAGLVAAARFGMELAHQHVCDPRAQAVPEFWSGRDTVYSATVADGLGVSLISSLFWQFGSGLVAAGAPLQNRGQGFSLDPGHPNVAGPGKRPFHTIIPAMVRLDGRVWAVFGLVGGPMQPQGQVQVLSLLIDHGLDPQAALDAPRARWLVDDLAALEGGLGADVAAALRAEGFEVMDRPLPSPELGAGQIIRIHEDGWLEGGADPRRDGVAFGR